VPEEVLDGEGYVGFFLKCVYALSMEKIVRRSPKGQKVLLLLDELLKMEHMQLADISLKLISTAYSCVLSGAKHRLPSASQGTMWKTFHQLRNSEHIRVLWENFITVTNCVSIEVHLALQLLLDRILKAILRNLAKSLAATSVAESPLTQREKNAIRYMAGYVAVALMKKYKRPAKKEGLQRKHRLFLHVLKQMRAEEQPGEVASLLDYTRLWSELIDRGGLYHVNDEVCYLSLFMIYLVHCFNF